MLNALDSSNYFQYNISAAHILGLTNAIYCSMIINIYQKAKNKKKIYDEFFDVDRNYITSKTTLDLNTQYECDSSLKKIGIIDVDSNSIDRIKLNYSKFLQIITNEDCSFLKEVSKKARTKNPSEVKETKKKRIVKALQEKINSGNGTIDEALHNWVRVVCEKTFMSCETVEDFQKVLMQYAKSDLKKALRIVEIATSQAWTSCVYAISSFEKEQEVLSRSINQPRVTNIRRGSNNSLSKETY